MKVYLSLILVALLTVGCASLDPALLTTTQTALIVSAAREKVAAADSEITDGDRQFIRDNRPRISYYLLAGTYAQYLISWDVDTFYRVIISGQGDIMTLEGATVKKLEVAK